MLTPQLRLPDAAIDIVVANADTILTRSGIAIVDDDRTVEVLRAAGLPFDNGRVRGRVDQLREIVSSAPRSFVQHAQDPALSVGIGAEHPPVFVPVYGPPNVRDDDGHRRSATMADYRELVVMADAAPAIGNTGHLLCVPDDVPEPERYLEMARTHLALSNKPFMGPTSDAQAVLDVVALVSGCFATGGPTDCRLIHLANSIPPLTFTHRLLEVMWASATSHQATIVTSFQLLGLTGPIAVLGSLSQGLAENLIGLALTQLHQPGAPVIFGIYGTPFDMVTMLPRFGDPISQLIQAGAVQLARRLDVPAFGYGGMTSSKFDDAQAGAEGGACTAAAIAADADFVLHTVGWLENGRTTGFAKFRRECDALAEHRPRRGRSEDEW